MMTKLKEQWNVYIFSLNTLDMDDTKITAPRIGICSNEITINNSEIDSSRRGCVNDTGIGAGKKMDGCAGSGGSHGGDGGYGGSESDEPHIKASCKSA